MNLKKIIILLIIFFSGFFLRVYGLNWDENNHLQPDERFLTMVGNSIRIPQSFSNYLNPEKSTLNPFNNNYNSFVYGMLPVTINKILAVSLKKDDYDNFTLLGRFLSALSDSLVIIVVYFLADIFVKKYKFNESFGYVSALFYAITVLPIQLSHFFAVDTFLNFFSITSLYFILKFSFYEKKIDLILSAFLFGLSISSKVTAIYILPLLIFFLIATQHPKNILLSYSGLQHIKVIKVFKTFFIFLLTTYISVRIGDPYYFQSANIFNPEINKQFIESLNILQSFSNQNTAYPPSIQWLHAIPVLFALKNIIFFGIGLPSFIFLILGLYFIWKKHKYLELEIISLWVVIFFLYQSFQFVKTMRYFIFIYPFLAIFCGLGYCFFLKYSNRVVRLFTVYTVFIWALCFISIYTYKNTRVAASEWIYQNIPNNSVILGEYWDDPLPLQLPKTYGKNFDVELLPVFDPETNEKWNKMNTLLKKGQYLILSSGRAYNNIPSAPERYPKTIKYYKDLFSGKLSYKKIKEFTSYPSLNYLGIPLTFNDDWAEEAFIVYDHPKVIIFKKEI